VRNLAFEALRFWNGTISWRSKTTGRAPMCLRYAPTLGYAFTKFDTVRL